MELRSTSNRAEPDDDGWLLDDGHDRETVADILDVSPRSTYHKYKRAYAYEFALDEFRRSGSGGQHPQAAVRSDASDDTAEGSPADADADDGRSGTGGNEAGRVSQASVVDDVAESDRGGAGGGSEPVGVGDVDPELIRMVNEAIIEQLSGDD